MTRLEKRNLNILLKNFRYFRNRLTEIHEKGSTYTALIF